MLCYLCTPGGFYSLLLCKQGGTPFQRSALGGFDSFNFGPPGGSLGTGQFGVISLADPGRIIQFGLKLNF